MRKLNWIAAVVFISMVRLAMAGPVFAPNGMVVSAEPNATQAGVEILKQGGNAFDAAAAVGFALAVTYPRAGNLGGGGFMTGLLHNGERIALDFRETAPEAASRDMFLDKNGELIPDLSTDSLLASGVPGSVRGLLRFQEDYGQLSRKEILAPAIRLAKKGFTVSESLTESLKDKSDFLQRFESTQNIFFPDGQPLQAGTVLKQPDLARTLSTIRSKGADGFYRGRVAKKIVRYMREQGGIITLDDLSGYCCIYRPPFLFRYKDYVLQTHPLPSSGGVTLAQILKFVEPMALSEFGHNSAAMVNRIVEAERLAFADRNTYLGDPAFVDVPERYLASDGYLLQRRKLMPLGRAGNSAGVRPGCLESMETTHFCVVDRDRNAVAITTTLNGSYGMGAVVEGAGFFLNNEMDDFSAKPGEANLYGLVQAEANAIEPGKRMLSSMTPTIVTQDDTFAFTMGTPGGPTIITTNAQIFLNIVEFGMDIQEAIDAPRFHHQWLPDEIAHEPDTFTSEAKSELETMGYIFDERESMGLAEGIMATGSGLTGHSDRRGSGLAEGY